MPKQADESRKWTIPNVLTTLRLVMAIGVAVCFLREDPIFALILYICAMLTDFADGYIARKYHQISKLGKLLDPLADKFMFVASMCGLYRMGHLPGILLLIVAVKECLMLAGGLTIYWVWGNVMVSNLFGKLASVSYSVGIVACFLHKFIAPFDVYIMTIAVIWNVLALFVYAYINIIKVYQKKKSKR